MSGPTDKSWLLEKYSRYVLPSSNSSVGCWSDPVTSCDDQRIVMTLTHTKHVVLTHGSVVLETHCLTTARAWMRGICKNDSLLFVYKQNKGTRRFKVKFCTTGLKSASELCSEAAHHLSAFFFIQHRSSTSPLQQNPDSSKCLNKSTRTILQLDGKVSLGTVTQVILGESTLQLPTVYKANPGPTDISLSTPDSIVKDYVRLFLMDPSFPAFVEQVDSQLKVVIAECQPD